MKWKKIESGHYKSGEFGLIIKMHEHFNAREVKVWHGSTAYVSIFWGDNSKELLELVEASVWIVNNKKV